METVVAIAMGLFTCAASGFALIMLNKDIKRAQEKKEENKA
ncbi:MAG: hypothetical protein ACI4VI_08795 [Acutalibacteraceae bacterium]